MSGEPAPDASPQNLDAEEAVLGAMMVTNKAIDKVEGFLQPADFYRESHGIIFSAACELSRTCPKVDEILLIDKLAEIGELENVGGGDKIHRLMSLVPTASNVLHYATIVKNKKAQRELIRAGGDISQIAWRDGPIDEARAKAEEIIKVAVTDHATTDMPTTREGLDVIVDQIRAVIAGAAPMKGLDSGFLALDKLTNGFHPGQLIVIAARPSMGKSVLAQNIAENVADAHKVTQISSLEMQSREIQLRSLARQAKIPLDRLRTGQLEQEDLIDTEGNRKLDQAVTRIKARNVYLDIDGSATPAEVRVRARRLQQTKGLDLLVVDYLQLMQLEEPLESRNQEISVMTRAFKAIATDLEIPVILVSQLSRAVDSRPKGAKRPTLGDLRDSGAIEQDADVVVFLYRDDYYNPKDSDSPGVAELIVAKNRMGSTDTVRLSFVGAYQTFLTIPET